MDLSESMKIVSSRIQEIEPEHASKVVGYLLLQDYGDQDMIRLAFSPDNVIKTVTNRVKETLGLSYLSMPPPLNTNHVQYYQPYQGFPISRDFSTSNMPLSACWNVQLANALEDQLQRSLKVEDDNLDLGINSLELELYNNNYSYPDYQPRFCRFASNRPPRRSLRLTEFSPKVCHYFSKGFCKHGNSCKFFHSSAMTLESFSRNLGLGSNNNGYGNDDPVYSVGSLEKLEMDLIELLRSRKGSPISIASLPTIYYEKFGRTLQAEGYLTESQRHGKAGCTLTRLLARLKNTICLIDRPHGQHSVVLAEDAPKYLDYASDRNEHGGIVPGSRQIYLTFPAESAFSEIDVSNYFNTYGPVQDVRIPSQEKRMFGFVTFVYPDTVQKILAKGNPHFVCGARVLVKPYREKSRLNDRKHAEKLHRSMQYNTNLFDGDPEFHSLPRASDYSRLMKKQFMEEHREALEIERTTLSESQLLPKPSARLQYFADSIDEFRLAQEFPTLEQFDFRLNNLNNGSSIEDISKNVNTNSGAQESNQVLNLPDNPFATAITNSISTAI